MAKFECKCGDILSNSNVPNNVEYHVYSDLEWDKIIAEDVIESVSIPRPRYEVWICPKCQRVYIFEDNKVIRNYVIEK